MRDPALFAKIGGETLRAVITDFYRRVFDDVMIGFMFESIGRGAGRQHLIDREWEFAANFLGAPGVTYTGRPLRAAHASHRIFGGHFERRLQLLRETMADHGVDPDVQAAWIGHTQALRGQITGDQGSECKDTRELAPRDAVAPAAVSERPIKLGRK